MCGDYGPQDGERILFYLSSRHSSYTDIHFVPEDSQKQYSKSSIWYKHSARERRRPRIILQFKYFKRHLSIIQSTYENKQMCTKYYLHYTQWLQGPGLKPYFILQTHHSSYVKYKVLHEVIISYWIKIR